MCQISNANLELIKHVCVILKQCSATFCDQPKIIPDKCLLLLLQLL